MPGRGHSRQIATSVKALAVDAPLAAMRTGLFAASDPTEWKNRRRQARDEAFRKMRAAFPEFAGQGTVDLIGVQQGALLAHGRDYRPQPVFQSFVAYTPWLLGRNQQHLRSTSAAQELFVSINTIDARYPLSDLGNGIVDLLSTYQPDDVGSDYVRFRRRSAPIGVAATPAGDVDAALGAWVPVPRGTGALLVRADLRPSALGSLVAFALRLPPAHLMVRFADGQELPAPHRIVPAVAAEGFLLSPFVDVPAALASLSMGRPSTMPGKEVVALKLDASDGMSRAFFQSRLRVHMIRLNVPSSGAEALSPQMREYFRREDTAVQLARSVAGSGQTVEARGGPLLFAHAPASPEIAISGPSSVRVRYGILKGAWTKGNHTDGVCFRIRMTASNSASRTLHEKCLQPFEHPEDRAEQETTVRVDASGPVTLAFETECRANCSWDWSYWKDIDVVPPAGDVATPTLAPLLDREAAVTRLAQSVAGTGQIVEARGTLLFAHPRSSARLELPRIQSLRVSYGMFKEAWTDGRHSDGVCFRIFVVPAGGKTRKLHEQCLTPLERAADRTDQQFAIRLNMSHPATLVFETDCRNNCSWDWAYWKDIDVTQ